MIVGFGMPYKLQLSLTTVPASLGSLASGWLIEHGNSLFPAGMSARKNTLSNLAALIKMTHKSELHVIEVTPHHCCSGSLDNE